jgi:hypothetical protein
MNNNLFFLCCGVAFLVFSIIVICTAPIITGVLPKSDEWNTQNCKIKSDAYDIYEKNHKNPTEAEKIKWRHIKEKFIYAEDKMQCIVWNILLLFLM